MFRLSGFETLLSQATSFVANVAKHPADTAFLSAVATFYLYLDYERCIQQGPTSIAPLISEGAEVCYSCDRQGNQTIAMIAFTGLMFLTAATKLNAQRTIQRAISTVHLPLEKKRSFYAN
jgi:hypothetical protein